MIDKEQELIMDLESELLKLDEAYIVGDHKLTLRNLGYDVSQLTQQEIDYEYYKVAKRIFEIQSLLNVQNQN